MKTTVRTIVLTALFLAAMVLSSQAILDHGHRHSGTESVLPGDGMPEMRMERIQMRHAPGMFDTLHGNADGGPCNGPCMTPAKPPARHHMTGTGASGMLGMKPGMMQQRMDHEFFLDRIEILELNTDQVTRLKSLRSDCRKDNIRNAAEVQIVRLELQELLNSSDWTIEAAEPLIRKIQKLEGDMLVRHLQGKTEARTVLSAEQLQKVDNVESNDLKELFE